MIDIDFLRKVYYNKGKEGGERVHLEVYYREQGKDALSDIFHTHDGVFELICIRAGRGKVFVGERVLPFTGDTVLLIDGSALHYICPDQDVTYLRHKLIFDKRLLAGFALPCVEAGLFYRIPTPEQALELDRYFELLEKHSPGDEVSLLLFSQVFALLHLCIEQGGAESASYHGTMADAVRYIHQNLAQGITLQGVAQALHINKFHLCRLFKRETGMTMGAYVNSCRIANAKRLLRTSEESVSFIAAECGFNELSVFTRNFKKEVGMTPTEYKAQSREKTL